jgi:hypothetical protein
MANDRDDEPHIKVPDALDALEAGTGQEPTVGRWPRGVMASFVQEVRGSPRLANALRTGDARRIAAGMSPGWRRAILAGYGVANIANGRATLSPDLIMSYGPPQCAGSAGVPGRGSNRPAVLGVCGVSGRCVV